MVLFPIVNDDVDCQTFVSNYCQMYNICFGKNEYRVIQRIFDVLKLRGHYAVNSDFPDMSRDNFYQIISRLCKKCNIVKKIPDGKFTMYTLDGIEVSKNVRQKGRGIDQSLIFNKIEQLYLLTKNQEPGLHNIHLNCKTSNLYSSLKKQEITPTKKNQFVIPIGVNPRFASKAIISPNGRLDLYVGCSQFPIPATFSGFDELKEHVAECRLYLRGIAHSDFISPPAREWIFVCYHFNRDSEPIHDPQYRFSLGQHSDYCYIKTFDDGTVRARYENKVVQKKSFENTELELMKKEWSQIK